MTRLLLFPAFLLAASVAFGSDYDALVAQDKPASHWTSNPALVKPLLQGGAAVDEGPRPPEFPDFIPDNHSVAFRKPGARVVVPDTGADSIYDFKKGDSITIEAWVQCDSIGDGQNVYVAAKGRTGRAGQPPHNQNWGLRLRESDGTARLSFVFRDERDATSKSEEFWHRWTSGSGFLPGDGWHHIAISYTFGKPDSIHGFLDGSEVTGAWDMGGPTELGPWVDDDELWFGTSMGGSAANSLRGRIDEVALYRTALKPATLKARYSHVAPLAAVDLATLPPGKVRVEILEHGISESDAAAADWTVNDSDQPGASEGVSASWGSVPSVKTEEWIEPSFALADVVEKYSPRGVRRDRSIPYLVRLTGAVTLPPGEHRLLVRAMRGGRLSIDGKVVATSAMTPKPTGPTLASDAEPVPDQLAIQLVKDVALLPPGHSEAIATFHGDGKSHVFMFETFVGGKGLRPELGEPSVAISTDGAPYRLLTCTNTSIDFTDAAWHRYAQDQRARIAELAAQRRANTTELAYWQSRHSLAKSELSKKAAITPPSISNQKSAISNEIDSFIQAKLPPTPTLSPVAPDPSFLRRVTLDTIGLVPTPDELASFLADTRPDKRARAIDRLLTDPRWADQWVPYWQDVLAENPALLKPTLNNTGPFRWFLYEALRDNWAMDRFVTALTLMEGSTRNGGSAGFAVATQNDLPMANKAQILSSAFLGMEMKCASCHDAPNHPFNQGDLFALSAMLQRAPVKVPGSSLTQGLNPNSHVTVSLKAGEKIDAHWPFADLAADPLPGTLRNPDDSRERLAAIITDPRNERFPQVVVNRLWKRLLGWGIVDPVDDWENARPSHKELLAWLGRELVSHDYDLKHIARLILNSATYQRMPTDAGTQFAKPAERFFQSPARRRLSAEQLVDSLFQVAGKEFETEPLNFDLDARRSVKDFLNAGTPGRAWEFVGLSNERDRPALAKPVAQTITDVLANFGWRDTRAEPRTTRDDAPNVLQPAVLANGLMGARITRLSDDSAFTTLALRDQSLDALVSQLFARVLSRAPSEAERRAFTSALSEGFADRILAVPTGDAPKKPRLTKAVMWSNHLNPESTTAIYDWEKLVRAGDPPTPRLSTSWRERMEDAVWALMLTPEFTYIP